MTQEKRWWFYVRYLDDFGVQVERFETEEQAELYAAITGGCVLGPYDQNDPETGYFLMRLSERTK